MRKIVTLIALTFVVFITFQACRQSPQESSYETAWLGDSKKDIFDNVEEQFQGFSRTMVEVSYRYKELYWAGTDQNREYAEYQREHIEEAMELGFMRRPERRQSAQQFMNTALPEMEEVIQQADKEAFLEAFNRFTASCNTCHAMEEVGFMIVKVPSQRTTVIHF